MTSSDASTPTFHRTQSNPHTVEDIDAILAELNIEASGHDDLRVWSAGPGVVWDLVQAFPGDFAVKLVHRDEEGREVLLRRTGGEHWQRA